MNRYGIVVVGYNRTESIERLCNSLCKANYSEPVDLIVSIDNSGEDKVEKYAETIIWNYGNKIIKTFPERLGLRNHILTCGNYLNEFDYDAIVVLEDDIVVAEDFFNFVVQAVERYRNDDNIAGISLYTHLWNATADRPFIPLYCGYDIFFMRYPQSWGQVWMKKQWNEFYKWYKDKEYLKINRDSIPNNVMNWPESSWLKFHVQYCIARNKYFVYPYQSLSTNFADAGTHYAFNTNKMQVPLSVAKNKKYIFPDTMEINAVYDEYYESKSLGSYIGENTLINLYGQKKHTNENYILSMEKLPYKIIKSYGLQMRPVELNVINDVKGNDLYLYDTAYRANKPKKKHISLIRWIYDTRGEVILKHNFADIIFHEIYNKLRYVIKMRKK